MSRRRLLIPLLLLAVAGGAYAWWHSRNPEQGRQGLTLYGNVDVRQVDLGFRVDGRIAEVLVEEGDPVEPDLLLARLDDGPYRRELDLREAEVAEREANLRKLRAGSRPEEIARAEAHVAEREAAYRDARLHLDRQARLLRTNAVSEADYDQALARRDLARARLRTAREDLKLAREGFRAEDIAAAEAALAATRAGRDLARTRVEDTRLHAPSAGTVLTRVREPGAIVGAGQTVVSVSVRKPVWVRAYVPEPHLGRIAPGMPAEVYTDSRPDRPYAGQIGFVSPQAEFTPKSVQTPELRTALVFRLRVVISDPDDALRQGMPVTVRIPGARPAGAGDG